MKVGWGSRIAVVACALAAVLAASAADASASGVVAKEVTQDPASVRAYWTAERMRAAVPISLGPRARLGARATRGKPSYVLGGAQPERSAKPRPGRARAEDLSGLAATFPERVHGKVFLTLDRDYVCSGTVVRSPAHTLVWTAGHCVNGADIGFGFARNWVFVPGYSRGQRPYGTWTASKLMAADGWVKGGNIRFDLGAAVLSRDPNGRGIEDVVGARGIAFNQPREQVYDAFGYPALDPNGFLLPPDFDGEVLYRCRSPRTADDSPYPPGGPATMKINCEMTAGASGGGWVVGNDFVASVTSYGYTFDAGHLFGPYQGREAEKLYKRAGGKEHKCAGRAATNVGSKGIERFNGTSDDDSFVMFGGDDQVRAKAGADHVCGGGGDDRLVGGPGRDVLVGGPGNDVLIGGPGRDVCVGGPGRDRAIGCAVRKGIP